jgi:glycosyltransferase involved in cell wall biosynthesis
MEGSTLFMTAQEAGAGGRNRDGKTMKHILLNAANLNGAGARAVGISLIPALARAMDDCRFSVYLPDHASFRSMQLPGNVSVSYVEIRRGLVNDLARFSQLLFALPQIARRTRPDLCLTLGDLAPAFLNCSQVVLFHQALLVYPSEEIGHCGWHPLKRLFLEKYFRWAARSVTRFIVQTDVMAQRLVHSYRIENSKIAVIPQPLPGHVTIEAAPEPHPGIAGCSKPIRLLFLAGSYPHKNHAILPMVVQELRSRGRADQVQFFLTVDEASLSDSTLLAAIRENPDVITNLGPLPMAEVQGALRAASALFLPTLVESYGLIYLEAMACGLPIVTSDRDFSRWICRDLARYFDPHDPRSVADTIEALPGSIDLGCYRELCGQNLARFPRDWDVVAGQFAEVIGGLSRDA